MPRPAKDLRQAGMFVMLFNLLLPVIAMLSTTMTVLRGGGNRDLNRIASAPEPTPQLPPDDEKMAILSRLGWLPLADLMSVGMGDAERTRQARSRGAPTARRHPTPVAP